MTRILSLIAKCASCDRVQVGEGWMRERREYYMNYHPSLCPHCAALGRARGVLLRKTAPQKGLAQGQETAASERLPSVR